MKKSILFLTLLSNLNLSYSCGWWPSGDEVRFSLFSNKLAGQKEMTPLFYSQHYFHNYRQNDFAGPKENIDEWKSFFYNKFSNQTIDHVIYSMKLDGDYKYYLNNPMFKYLAEGNQPDVAKYIIFSKKVELLLDFDPWNKEDFNADQLMIAQKIALNRATNNKIYRIKQRYAYQYIVISYYLNDAKNVKFGYSYFFKNAKETVLKYWAMVYLANVQDSNINRLYLLSKAFTHSNSKCKYIYNQFPKNDSIFNLVLEKCKTNKEKASVLCVKAFKNPGRALSEIEEISFLDPNLELLDILLIREINKIEDWYLSYKYTSYSNLSIYGDNYEDTKNMIQKRLNSDKLYLEQFLNTCLKTKKNDQIKNKALWNTSIAYLYYMLDKNEKSKKYLDNALNDYPNNKIKEQIELISFLNFTASHQLNTKSNQNQLMELLTNLKHLNPNVKDQIILALSINQIQKGNIALGALLASKNKNKINKYYSWYSQKEPIFNVLNLEANSKDIDEFFEIWNKPNKSKLETYLLDSIQDYKWYYTDLWATQYFREDKLSKALEIYKTIPTSFWNRGEYEMSFQKKRELKSNPFGSNFYGLQKKESSTKRYTKPEFVQEIMNLKHKLKYNKKNKAHHALLLGNAYYNMTIHGNSPYYTEYYSRYPYIDKDKKDKRNRDYFYNCKKAIKYYKLAEKLSPNKAYSAFCFRMIVKCVSQAQNYCSYDSNNMSFSKSLWKKFTKKYPKHSKKLSGCDHFEYYSNAWKIK